MIKKIVPISSIVLLTLLFIYCTTDESTIIGPFGNAGKYITVASFSADKTLLYSNGDTTLISIKVLDVDKTPAIGLIVNFSAQFGKITESDTTDSSGVAIATFVSDDNTGENIITADTGVKTETLLITVVKYQPTYLILSAESPVILADGKSRTKITAVLKDSVGNPMAGMTVNFKTTLGDIVSPIEITDESGTAYSELISSDTIGTATITATSGIESTIDVKFHMDVPAIIELSVGNPVLLADGISTTIITAVVKDSLGHRMDNESVRFLTTKGTFVGATDSKIEITDQGGTAQVELISSSTPGTALIIATSFVSDSVEVEFKQHVPVEIDISSEMYTLLADGISSTEITAIPRDDQGRKMPNIPVYFSTTKGDLSSQIVNTEADGVAKTILTSTTEEGIATVTVTSYITRSVEISFQKYVPAYINLSAGSPVLLADGESSTIITAVLRDSDGKKMEGETVRFSTNLGTLSSPIEVTGPGGIATVTLFSSTAPGTALVIATSFVSDSVEVEFNINVPDKIEIFATPTIILADGQSISTITAIPKDKDNNPMPGMSVSFTTTLGNLKEKFVVTDAEGKAETDLISVTTDGTAYVTATSSAEATVGVQFIAYNPAYIKLITDIDGNTVLADGKSEINIIAEVYNSANQIIPWALVDFSTTHGSLNKTTVRADQTGKAIVTLTSAGSAYSYPAVVTAGVQGTSISENISVKFRGISIATNIDSVQFATGGYYKVYIRTHLFDVELGEDIENATVVFSSTIGLMDPKNGWTDEFGRSFSILFADVTGADQSGLKIYSKLWFAPKEVIDSTESMVIPGVEALISTIDDEVMGDGEGWALVKATLREITGNKAITDVGIDWATTLGTIIGRSKTNTTGHTIDTLRIENSVSTNTDVTITANFGENVSASDIVTFISPVGPNRLILGFEPDTVGHGIIPCDIDTVLATRDVGISALYNRPGDNDGYTISFSVVPKNLAVICPTAVTVGAENGRAIVMMAYPPQNAGQIVRVWAEAPDGTRGSIDVILPKDEEEEDSGGG